MIPQIEAFYGGAAGGGKSDALLMAALQYADVSGYAAILFRRTYTDLSLPEALMDRAQQWLGGSNARWSDKEKTWHFPSTATLSFGYLESENDKYRYQSAAFQFVGFDELTQFTETQYRYLFSRLRRLADSPIPIRMRGASNPGGVGHNWVKQRFIIEGEVQGRPFIPARLADNSFVDQLAYVGSLENLDPITRQQLKEGDWFARPSGKKFKREWFEIVTQAPAQIRKIRYWDLAATEAKPGKDPDYTCGVLIGEMVGVFYVVDAKRLRAGPGSVEALIKQTAYIDTLRTPIYMEQEPGSSGVNTIDHYTRSVLIGYDFHGNKTTGSKEIRANPFSSAAEAHNVKLVQGPWIGDFLDEIESFPEGAHDDQVDAASGAFSMLTLGGYAWELPYSVDKSFIPQGDRRDLSKFAVQPKPKELWDRDWN